MTRVTRWLTPEDAEVILREFFTDRIRTQTLAARAMKVLAKGQQLRFWSGLDARTSPEMAKRFKATSCARTIRAMGELHKGAQPVLGYALRWPNTPPAVYSFLVMDGVVLDGGIDFWGRPIGYLGVTVSPADLATMLAAHTNRAALEAIVGRAEVDRERWAVHKPPPKRLARF